MNKTKTNHPATTKKGKDQPGYWPRRPGYNAVLGYIEDKREPILTGGMREIYIDRTIKDGTN